MTIWCVNTVDCEHFHGVYGVYSNLAVAGNAAMQCFRNTQQFEKDCYDNDNVLTCRCIPESWGYSIIMFQHDIETEKVTLFGVIEIGKMELDE
jgi:hypothetical protein